MAKLEVLYGPFFLATLSLQICSSAVICPPCGPGEFCDAFFGMCLACADYCPDGDDCTKECSHNKLSTTILPTPIPNQTSFHPVAFSTSTEAPDIVVTSTDKLPVQSDGGGSKEYLELSLELLLGLLFVLILFAICGWFCLKRRQTLQMLIRCCLKTRDSHTDEDIELAERRTRNRRYSNERVLTIRSNPVENPTPLHPLTTNTVQVADEVGTSVINQPGPSGLNSSRSRIRATDTRPASHEHLTPPVDVVHPFQSARINPNNGSPLEHERLLGAVPSNNQSGKQKTPETLRKITDGTLEGHLCVPGASPFIPAPYEHEWNRDSDGD